MKTKCKHCGAIHDISMPMCDECLKKWKEEKTNEIIQS